MKRISLTIVVALLILGLLSVGAGAHETLTVKYTANNTNATDAKAFSSFPDSGSCNKAEWEIPFTTEVQVAQWLNWTISGTKWTWFVRKPGDYYTNCISATVKSNGNVAITFAGFADLAYQTGEGDYNGLEGVNQYIQTWYGYSEDEMGPAGTTFSGWIAADDLDDQTPILSDSQDLHDGLAFKLWNRINVVNCNSAGTYRNTGTITIAILNQLPWIDEDGDYPDPANNEKLLKTFITDVR